MLKFLRNPLHSAMCNLWSVLLCFVHLYRLYKMVKDFCGVVSEASVRGNLILIMELLNEYLVGGCIQ